MTLLVIAITECDRSRGTSLGAGATIVVESPIIGRFRGVMFEGGGAMMELARLGVERLSRVVSGGGAIAFFNSSGVVCVDFTPSVGGGPGLLLKASRFATGSFEMGSFKSGASTTFSTDWLPRATRIVWVRWKASLPPALPLRPDCAPPASKTFGNSSGEK